VLQAPAAAAETAVRLGRARLLLHLSMTQRIGQLHGCFFALNAKSMKSMI
jgi:hypothetical protein